MDFFIFDEDLLLNRNFEIFNLLNKNKVVFLFKKLEFYSISVLEL